MILDYWKDIERIILLGTDKTTFGDKLLEYLAQLGVNTQQVPSKIALDSLLLYTKIKQSGFRMEQWQGTLNERPKPTSAKQYCTPTALEFLKKLLKQKDSKMLEEFLGHAKKNNRAIPPLFLPNLFDESINNATLWKSLKSNLDSQAIWLLKQNPDWSPLLEVLPATEWEVATTRVRLQIFKYWRVHNPSKATALLASTWEKDSARQRATFLMAFAKNLSINDENFLEKSLDDRKIEVRKEAQNLLAQLPDSQYVERRIAALKNHVAFKNNLLTTLEVTLPEEISGSMKRDGISNTKNVKSLGLRANYLFQIIKVIPPQKWEEIYGLPPQKLLGLIQKNKYAEAILLGIFEATLLHKDNKWAILLLTTVLNQRIPIYHFLRQDVLVGLLSAEQYNDILADELQKTKSIILAQDAVFQLLLQGNHPWSNKVSKKIFEGFQDWLSAPAAREDYRDAAQFQRILERAASQCDPFFFENIRWNTSAYNWYRWRESIEKLSQKMSFRKAYITALS